MSVLVGKQAPDFNEKAVVKGQVKEHFTLSQFRGKKYVVLFFYPFDFTFVCPTELHAFQANLKDFQERNTEIIAVSTDSWHSHMAWLETPVKKGGIQGVTYPIVSDFQKSISRNYDVLIEETGAAYRGAFIIDKEGLVQSQIVNNLPLGRNVDEIIRLVDALQFTEEHGEVCPANWNKGDKTMKESKESLEAYFSG